MGKVRRKRPGTTRTTQFRFATDILRRLGEELNPSPDQGILELVKNAYDADASECIVELTDTEVEGGAVRVSDDGNGMALDDIVDGWLVLGRSCKSSTQRTRLGRIPAGSKGLGRLAAIRMGDSVRLVTRPRTKQSIQFEMKIDWSDYHDAELVDDVKLLVRQRRRPPGSGTGSDIYISDLRNRIGRMDVKQLARAMILLADPFGDDPSGFSPKLVGSEFDDLEALVEKRYFDEAEYHLKARVARNGRATASVVDFKGKALFKATHSDLAISRDGAKYECPSSSFDLWVFILNKTTFDLRTVTLSEVRDWLSAFGGVHLYHGGLRVSPYGNPGNDWLDLNLRRAQSPEERPSTNTSIGRVSVNESSDLLIQKTDRSGFIEGDGFLELRAFAQDALEWMAKRRLEMAEKRRAVARRAAPRRTSRSKKTLDKVIERAPKSVKKELEDAANAYDKSRQKEVDSLKKEVQLYRTLSTAGITAATFAHESSGNPIKIITISIRAIERRAKRALSTREYGRVLQDPIQSIVAATESLGVLGSATLDLLDHEKRRAGRVEVHRVINKLLETYEPFLNGRDVVVETDYCKGVPYFRATAAALESVITNLINNSLASFESSDNKDRRILITTELEAEVLTLRVADNGPGIIGIRTSDIWLPGQTTRKGGTGLGLTIVRDTVSDFGGYVDAVEKSSMGGAEIVIEIPVLGK